MGIQIASLFATVGADLSGLTTGLAQAQTDIRASGKTLGALGADADKAIRQMQPLGVALTAVGAAGVAGLGAAVSMAADFQSQVALMGVAAGDAGVGLDTLHDAALQVGGDIGLVGVTASGAADSITNLLKAGLSIEDVFGDMNKYMAGTAELGGVLRASIDLAAASELDMAAASKVVSVAMSTFGLDTTEATAITDNFVQTADASVASVGELADAMVNIGPTAAAFGWELEDVNTALAVLSQRGIVGAEAGTALKSMMTHLMSDTVKVREALADLNVELYDQEGHLKTQPAILGELGAALAGVTEQQRNQTIQTLAGTYGMKAMNTLLAAGPEGWANMEASIAGAATAMEIAQAKTNTLQGRLEALGGTVEAAGIAIGETFLDDLTGLSDWAITVTDAFNDLSPAAKETVSNLLLIGTAGALAAGGLILIVPKIAATVTALSALSGLIGLPGLLANIGLGFKMLGAGVSTATIASGGFGAVLGGIVAPLAALAGVILLGNKLLEGHEDTIVDASRSYPEYIHMVRLAGDAQRALNEAEWEALKHPGIVKPIKEIDTSQIEGMSAAQFRLADSAMAVGAAERVMATELAAIEGAALTAEEAIENANKAIAASYELLGAVISGPVGAANEKFIEQQGDIQGKIAELQAKLDDYQRQNGRVVNTQDDITVSMEDTVLAMASAESTANKLATAQQRLADNTDPDKQLALEAALIRAARAQEKAGAALVPTGARSYIVDYTEEIDAVQGEIAELEGSLVSLAAQHRDTMNSIIFGMMEARLATDGWTAAEVELAWGVAESMDMIDTETLTAITSVNQSISDYEAGLRTATGVIYDVNTAVDVASGSIVESGGAMYEAAAMAVSYIERLEAVPSTVDTDILQNEMAYAREQARNYVAELEAAPITVSTDILQPYMEESQSAAGVLRLKYDEVQDSVSTEFVQMEMAYARAQARAYAAELGAIPRSVSTTITARYVTTREGDVLPVSPIGGTIPPIPEHAVGTPYVPRTGLALLHRGEAVLPTDEAAAYRRGGMGGGTWHGDININGAGDPQATAAAVMQALQDRGILSGSALR